VALINTWQGATEALKKPWPQNLAAFASVVSTGLGAVKAIRGTTSSGSGGGGGGTRGGGGAAATPAAAAPSPTQTLNFTISNDPFGFGERVIRQLAQQLNEASRNGSTLKAVVS
jgi:hypothetical protein